MGEQRVWYGLQAGLVVFWLIVPLVGLLGFHVPFLTIFAAIILLAPLTEAVDLAAVARGQPPRRKKYGKI